jgi:hypothetical protein
LIGSAVEWVMTAGFRNAAQDFTTGIPGMLIQIFGGYLLLQKMKDYGN